MNSFPLLVVCATGAEFRFCANTGFVGIGLETCASESNVLPFRLHE